MRITTHMLNETARKTGIPINQNNLLSYLNNSEGTSGSTLLDALNKNNKVSTESAENYKKLESAADKLKDSADKLAAEGDKSLFEKIRQSEGEEKEKNTEELYASVNQLLDHYNSTLTELRKNASPMNIYYSQSMQEAVAENSEALEKLGITMGKDGKLSIDNEKLKSASVDDIEKVFGKSGSFTSKISFVAGRVSDNAQANVESSSSQYSSKGSLQSQIASKFDFWS